MAEEEEFKYTINVLGEPMGKQRPRATSFGGHTRIYTPSKTLSYEARFAHEFKEKYPEAKPLTGPIRVEVFAFFGLKKADYNSKGEPTEIAHYYGHQGVSAWKAMSATFDPLVLWLISVHKRYDLTPSVTVAVWEYRFEYSLPKYACR